MLEVSDDSGFLALVVPATYETFVASDWSFDQLLQHFQAQMRRHAVLIWATGLEGLWKVSIKQGTTDANGFREATGQLQVGGGSMLLTNYESLTMAAEFEDFKLPEKHQANLLIPLADGDYSCRIVQMFDPETQSRAGDAEPDFLIEISKSKTRLTAWEAIPWFKADA